MAFAKQERTIPVQGSAFHKVARHLPQSEAFQNDTKCRPVIRVDQGEAIKTTALQLAPRPAEHVLGLAIPEETFSLWVPLHHRKGRIVHMVCESLNEFLDLALVAPQGGDIPHRGDE